VEVEIRQAALCIIWRGDSFLVAELIDPHTGVILHRPPGGGIEEGESPEDAVRRELQEELGILLTCVHPLGAIDHIWLWKGREVRERAWLFVADCSDDSRLSQGETLDIVEADGKRHRTFWRSLKENGVDLPPVCPSGLLALLTS
jgi:8-oxo-dGTP pyrophosphatase MutT (NUDIX family)